MSLYSQEDTSSMIRQRATLSVLLCHRDAIKSAHSTVEALLTTSPEKSTIGYALVSTSLQSH